MRTEKRKVNLGMESENEKMLKKLIFAAEVATCLSRELMEMAKIKIEEIREELEEEEGEKKKGNKNSF